MADQVQIRRGTGSVLDSSVPALAELGYDTTNKRLRLGDGSTVGGMVVPNGLDAKLDKFTTCTVGGTANAITLTSQALPATGYTSTMKIRFLATATNTGPVTVDLDGLGPVQLWKVGVSSIEPLVGGDIILGVVYEAFYGGTRFQLGRIGTSGIQEVRQGDLLTGLGSVSTGLSGNFTLPGGQYGFYPVLGVSSGSTASASIASSSNWGGNVPRISLDVSGGGSPNLVAYQRYIVSSPPFDLGDGETGGFIFVQIDNVTGHIVNSYIADVPPWAYNGPTDIRASHVCKATGRKFRKVRKRGTLEEIMDGAKPVYELEEITHDIKNADMNLIPHPFGEVEGLTTVLLDPMDDKIRRLIELQNQGGAEDVMSALSSGKIRVDNECLNRCGPRGVQISKMKYKFSKKF